MWNPTAVGADGSHGAWTWQALAAPPYPAPHMPPPGTATAGHALVHSMLAGRSSQIVLWCAWARVQCRRCACCVHDMGPASWITSGVGPAAGEGTSGGSRPATRMHSDFQLRKVTAGIQSRTQQIAGYPGYGWGGSPMAPPLPGGPPLPPPGAYPYGPPLPGGPPMPPPFGYSPQGERWQAGSRAVCVSLTSCLPCLVAACCSPASGHDLMQQRVWWPSLPKL